MVKPHSIIDQPLVILYLNKSGWLFMRIKPMRSCTSSYKATKTKGQSMLQISENPNKDSIENRVEK